MHKSVKIMLIRFDFFKIGFRKLKLAEDFTNKLTKPKTKTKNTLTLFILSNCLQSTEDRFYSSKTTTLKHSS